MASVNYISRKLWYYSQDKEHSAYRTPDSEPCEIAESALIGRVEPLVVLGEPGMGKSSLLRNLADTGGLPYCTARQLINRANPRSLLGEATVIIIDALDEVIPTASAVDSIVI